MFAFVVEGKTYTVPAGACTPAIKVSSGVVTVKEKWVVGVHMVSASTIPASRLVSVDLPNRTIKVEVVPGSIATQTVVTVVNKSTPGTLKVCQVAGAGVEEGTSFSFTNSATSKTISVPAGPATRRLLRGVRNVHRQGHRDADGSSPATRSATSRSSPVIASSPAT